MKLRKGFTLVELLIVIVIIGILAAAMLLSSGSATAAAEASNIVSDLRSMKAAALMYYADNMDDVTKLTNLNVSGLQKYMDNPNKFTNTNGYIFTDGGTTNWWVGFNLTTAKKTGAVGEKLANRSAGVGIYKTMDASSNNVYSGASEAYMIAR